MNEIVKSENWAMARPEATQVDMLIDAIAPAIKGGTDPAIVREQIALMKDLMAMKSKESFDAAMSRFKSTIPPVLKTKRVEELYSYAPLDSVVLQVKTELEEVGFTWSFDQDAAPAGQVTGVCVVNFAGHSERRAVTLPISSGNRASNATKDAAGALSFAQRRAFQNAFGIVIQGEDTDATFPKKPRGPSEPIPADPLKAAKSRLWKSMGEAGAPADLLLREDWLRTKAILPKGKKLSDLTATELAEAAEKVEFVIQESKLRDSKKQ